MYMNLRVLGMSVIIENDVIPETSFLMPSPSRASLTFPRRLHVGPLPRFRYVLNIPTWITTLLAILNCLLILPMPRVLLIKEGKEKHTMR